MRGHHPLVTEVAPLARAPAELPLLHGGTAPVGGSSGATTGMDGFHWLGERPEVHRAGPPSCWNSARSLPSPFICSFIKPMNSQQNSQPLNLLPGQAWRFSSPSMPLRSGGYHHTHAGLWVSLLEGEVVPLGKWVATSVRWGQTSTLGEGPEEEGSAAGSAAYKPGQGRWHPQPQPAQQHFPSSGAAGLTLTRPNPPCHPNEHKSSFISPVPHADGSFPAQSLAKHHHLAQVSPKR